MKNQSFKVYFSATEVVPPADKKNITLVFYPCLNPWNDQNFTTLYDLEIRLTDSKVHRLDRFTRFVFEGDIEGYDFINSSKNKLLSSTDVKVNYLSQLSEKDNYSQLQDLVSEYTARQILVEIHDASLLKSIDPRNENLELTSHNAFRISLLRSTTAYRAFMNGPGFLLNKASQKIPQIELNFEVKRFNNSHEVFLDFEGLDLFNNRTMVFVGKNGVGKSQALASLSNKLLEADQDDGIGCGYSNVILFSSIVDDYYQKSFVAGDPRGIYYKYVNLLGQDRHFGLLEAIKMILRGGRSERSKKRRIDLLLELLQKNISFQKMYLPFRKDENSSLEESEAWISRYFDLTKEVDRADFLERIDGTKTVIFRDKKDKVILSAGQEFFSNLVGRVLAFAEENTFFLFDEPETYLHPNLEVDFIDVLQTILSETESYAVIATHSVFITREIPRTHVFIFSEKSSEIIIRHPQIQTFGASLDQISDYIFGDLKVSKAFQRKLEMKLGEYSSFDKFLKKNQGELNPGTLLYLANINEADEEV